MKRSLAIITVLSLALSVFTVAPLRAQEDATEDAAHVREVLVMMRNPHQFTQQQLGSKFYQQTASRLGNRLKAHNISLTSAFDNSFVRVTVPDGISEEEFITSLQTSSEVALVEKNPRVFPLAIPNDSYYEKYQWNLPLINMPEAWDDTRGKGITVAVIDSGIAYENYGLFRQAPDFASTRFVEGYDFVDRDSRPHDEYGHGTHIAGIIAATMNNRSGIAGAAPEVNIMPVRILDKKGGGTIADLAEAVRWAADHGAKVINMSVGSYEGSQVLTSALAYAYHKGVVLVGATGNDGKEALMYPAAVSDYVIAVGAVDATGEKAYYSNAGTGIDLLAPGGDINVDKSGDGFADGVLSFTFAKRANITDTRSFIYTFAQGTSLAVPHVSAVAAMIASLGIEDPSALKNILTASASDLGPAGWDKESGAGLLNAAQAIAQTKLALTKLNTKEEAPPSPADAQPTVGEETSAPADAQEETSATEESSHPTEDNSTAVTDDESSSNASDAATEDSETAQEKTLATTVKFLNIFGRAVDSFVWWESPRIFIKVVDQDNKPVEDATLEIRYRFQGDDRDLGFLTRNTRKDGTAEVLIGPFKERKKLIEAGVLAYKNRVFAGLAIGTFALR